MGVTFKLMGHLFINSRVNHNLKHLIISDINALSNKISDTEVGHKNAITVNFSIEHKIFNILIYIIYVKSLANNSYIFGPR